MAVCSKVELGGAVAGHVAVANEGVAERASARGGEGEETGIMDPPHEFEFVKVLFMCEGVVLLVEMEKATLGGGVREKRAMFGCEVQWSYRGVG